MPAKSKGARIERDLASAFERNGFAVMKSPSSGSATTRDQPDVLALSGGLSFGGWAAEVKYSGAGHIYVDSEEVAALERFALTAGVRPAVACRWKGDTTLYLFDPEDAHRTPEGNYRFSRGERERSVATLLT